MPEIKVSKEETEKLGKTFVENYVSCIFGIVQLYKEVLRLDGSPPALNKNTLAAGHLIGNLAGGLVAAGITCVGGALGGGAAVKGTSSASKEGVNLWLKLKIRKDAKSVIKLITGEDCVLRLEPQAQKAQDDLELESFTKAGVDIFQIYESQIVQLYQKSRTSSARGNLYKLAEDAASRSMNFLVKEGMKKSCGKFNHEILVNGVILGESKDNWKSKLPFPLNWMMHPGRKIKTTNIMSTTTKSVYEKVGILARKSYNPQTEVSLGHYRIIKGESKMLKRKKTIRPKHGYRLIAPFEHKNNKEYFKLVNLCTKSQTWEYQIDEESKVKIMLQVKERFKQEGETQEEKIEKIIQSKIQWPTTPKSSVLECLFNVRNPVGNFVGRKRELEQLLKWFKEKRRGAVLIHGIGGQGKSELCRQFIYKLQKQTSPPLVTWFCGDNASQFSKSLSDFALELKISIMDVYEKPLSISSLIDKMAKIIKGQWVVVIDNVDKPYQEYKEAINAFQGISFLLVTSRKSDTLASSLDIKLKELKDIDAHEFVKNSIIKPIQKDELIENLCKILQNYPMALQQSVAFIINKQRTRDSCYGINEYLKVLQTDIPSAFSQQLDTSEYNKTIFKILEATIQEFGENKSACIKLLAILSLVNSDGINENFLKQLYGFLECEEKSFEKSIETLFTFSLIGVNKDIVSTHGMVQKIAQVKLKSDNFAKWNETWCTIITKIDTNSLKRDEISHVMKIWECLSKSSSFVSNYSNFPVKITERLQDLCLYPVMKYFAKANFRLLIDVVGEGEEDTLNIEFYVAISYRRNGEYEEALQRLEVVWKKGKKFLGEENEATLKSACGIASVLRLLDDLDKSMEWYQRVLKSQIKVLGEEHRDTLTTKNNMALLLRKQGNEDEALNIWEQMLKLEECKLGADHPTNLTTRHNIAVSYVNQGRFEEGKKELEKVLRLSVKVLGENHELTFATQSWLAIVFHSLGQEDKGIKMMMEVLLKKEKTLGVSHPETIATRIKLDEWK